MSKLELLPAVDVRRGPGGPAGPGRGRLRDLVRRPAGGGAGLAGSRRRVDPPGRPRRGVRPRVQPRAAGRAGRQARRRGRAVRRHPRRRLPRGSARHRLPPGQHRHRRAGEPGLGTPSRSPTTATGSPSGWTYAARRCRRAAGPRTAASSSTCWPGSTLTAAPVTCVTDVASDGTLPGPNLELLRQVCAAPTRPVVASGGVSSLDDLRVLRELVDIGVEGAIVGKALYAGAFTLEQALEVAG